MSFGFVALAGASIVGGAMASNSAKKSVAAQRDIANAAQESADEQLDAQVRQADELLAFNKKTYEEGKTRQVGIDAINKQVIDQNLGLSKKAGERADEAYDFYKTTGRPVVEKTINESSTWDSQGNIDAARGRATADVEQQAEIAQKTNSDALRRMGVNPSSGRFMALQQSLQATKQATAAGAATGAEDQRRTQGVQLRQQASNLAQGFPAQSMAQAGQSSGTGGAAAGVAGAGGAQSAALTSQALSGMSAGAGIYGNAAAGYSNIYGNALNGMNNAAASGASAQQGWGNLGGMALSGYLNQPTPAGPGLLPGGVGAAPYADGGKITGPGTGTSDEVPAVNSDTGQRIQLSNGEYVISADTVKALGTKYFDNLQKKHHTPVNLGRKAA